MSTKKKYFDWTDEKKYTLSQLVLKYKGYKSTEKKHLEKWETILEKLKLKPGFEDLDIKPIPLQTQFKRMQEETLKACGISMEGANLSGLDEEPSDLVTIMCNMAEEVAGEKQHRDLKKQKKAEKNKAMTIYEKLQLAEQGRSAIKEEIKDEGPKVPVTEVATKSTSSGSGRKAGRSFLEDLRSDLRAIVIDGDDEEDEPASKKKKLDNETKKLELQERELKLREDELNESRQARKEQMDLMVAIIHKLATSQK